jgi:probable phosphoglycerate mutase
MAGVMTAGQVLLLRHGRTAFNVEGRFQGRIDVPLDEVGRSQAEQAAQAIHAAYRVTRVVSSDLSRAFATAAPFATLAGLEIDTDARLREWAYGVWEGRRTAEIQERWPAQYAAWHAGRDPGGAGQETRAQVAARMVEAIMAASGKLDADDTLLVVSHGAAIRLATTALLGLDPATSRAFSGMENAHWSHLRYLGPTAQPPWQVAAYNVGAWVGVDAWAPTVHAGEAADEAADDGEVEARVNPGGGLDVNLGDERGADWNLGTSSA